MKCKYIGNHCLKRTPNDYNVNNVALLFTAYIKNDIQQFFFPKYDYVHSYDRYKKEKTKKFREIQSKFFPTTDILTSSIFVEPNQNINEYIITYVCTKDFLQQINLFQWSTSISLPSSKKTNSLRENLILFKLRNFPYSKRIGNSISDIKVFLSFYQRFRIVNFAVINQKTSTHNKNS